MIRPDCGVLERGYLYCVCVVALDLEPQILAPHLCVCVCECVNGDHHREYTTSVGFLELGHSMYTQNDIIASFDHATAEKWLRPSPAVSLHPRVLVCAQCLRYKNFRDNLIPGCFLFRIL